MNVFFLMCRDAEMGYKHDENTVWWDAPLSPVTPNCSLLIHHQRQSRCNDAYGISILVSIVELMRSHLHSLFWGEVQRRADSLSTL